MAGIGFNPTFVVSKAHVLPHIPYTNLGLPHSILALYPFYNAMILFQAKEALLHLEGSTIWVSVLTLREGTLLIPYTHSFLFCGDCSCCTFRALC